MGFNSQGLWTPESSDVATQVASVVDEDGPLQQQAATTARKESNRRGLLNSSMAVQAGHEAVISSAMPIASQTAGQIHDQNVSSQGFAQQGSLQTQSEEHDTAEQIARRTFEASESGLARTHSTEQQTADIEARRALLDTELEQRTSEGALNRTHAATIATADREANEKLTRLGIVSNELLARLDNQTRITMSNLTKASQEKIAQMQVDSTKAQDAVKAAVNFSAQYDTAVAAVVNAPNYSPEQRTQIMNHLSAVRDSNFAMLSGMSNVDITWQSPGSPSFESSSESSATGPQTAAAAAPAPAAQPVAAPQPGYSSPPTSGSQISPNAPNPNNPNYNMRGQYIGPEGSYGGP